MTRWYAVLLIALAFIPIPLRAASVTIGETARSRVGIVVQISGVTVTYLEPGECYVQSPDRIGGIRVEGATDAIDLWDRVTVSGTFASENGEWLIGDATITREAAGEAIRPLLINNRDLGGGSVGPDGARVWDFLPKRIPPDYEWQWIWQPAAGLSPWAILARTFGTVTAVYYSPVTGARWFYIDDGFHAISDLSDTGVLVYSDAEVREGDYVSATGVSTTEPSFDDATKLVRVLRTRSSADVSVIRFADE